MSSTIPALSSAEVREIADALDRFPHLSNDDRAAIFHAFETAPAEEPPDPSIFLTTAILGPSDDEQAVYDWYEDYYRSEAARSWQVARLVWMTPIDPERPYRYHMPLEEAAHFAGCVSRADILAALAKAAHYNRETA